MEILSLQSILLPGEIHLGVSSYGNHQGWKVSLKIFPLKELGEKKIKVLYKNETVEIDYLPPF